MNMPTGLIKRSIDRPNIYLVCQPIEHSIASRKDLEYLVPLQMLAEDICAIPKTTVFMDSRALVCSTTTALITRLPPQSRSADIICDYSTALSEGRRKDIMEKFVTGECRILIYTEAAGMGVDVPDVLRVIQWTISRQLNISNFWQWAGRAGHNWNLSGVAILFYNKSQQVSDSTDEVLSLYQEPAFGSRSRLLLHHIHGFEFREPDVANTQTREANGNQGGLQNAHQPTGQGITGVNGKCNINDADCDLMPPPPPQVSLPGTLKFIERGLLWFLSTTGCRRGIIRQYFDDTNISPFQDSVETSIPTNSTPSPCCDNCHDLPNQSLSAAIISLLPPRYAASERDVRREGVGALIGLEVSGNENAEDLQVQENRTTSRSMRTLLKVELEKFRLLMWSQEGLNQVGGFICPEMIFQDKAIGTLVQKAGAIHDLESLDKVLERDGVHLRYSPIGPHASKLLEVILSVKAQMAGDH